MRRRGFAAKVLMKVVILAGGLGTRLTEETETRPKPMVEIGGRPILWHIMKSYAHFGFREFVVALGYKGDVIKRFFLDYAKLQSNFTVNLASGDVMRRGGTARGLDCSSGRHGRWRPTLAVDSSGWPQSSVVRRSWRPMVMAFQMLMSLHWYGFIITMVS